MLKDFETISDLARPLPYDNFAPWVGQTGNVSGTTHDMSTAETAAVILAAGMGTRMKSALPKVLHRIAGRPMVGHVLDSLRSLDVQRTVVVVGPDMDGVIDAVAPNPTAVQWDRLGTADAVRRAKCALAGFDVGTALVLYGDTPLIRPETLKRMLAARKDNASVVVLGFRPPDPAGYGRLILDEAGGLDAIVEDRDATPEQRAIGLCNSGVMAMDASRMFEFLDQIGNDNAKGEFYLTDIVAIARKHGQTCAVIEAPAEELMGVDSRAGLARAEAVWQRRRRDEAMEAGVTLLDPDSVWFSHDTVLACDVTIGANVVFGPGVTVESGAEIKPFSHLEGAHVGQDAIIGPFARLRPGAEIGQEAHVGNFVEVKNSRLAAGVKANHLSYIGDAEIGEGTNVGAGTITCNYDGYAKHRTVIGKSVFIGSNTALVAPVTVGDGAIVAAGSTVVRDVEGDALTIARGEQVDKPGRARSIRKKLSEATPKRPPEKSKRRKVRS